MLLCCCKIVLNGSDLDLNEGEVLLQVKLLGLQVTLDRFVRSCTMGALVPQ